MRNDVDGYLLSQADVEKVRQTTRRPSRAAVVLAAVLAFAAGAGFGAGVGEFRARRAMDLYVDKAREAADLKVEVIGLRGELALERAK